MKKQLLASLTLVVFIGQVSFATPFQISGTRPLGMGGAYVAIAEGVNAQYWNPGALGITTGSGFQIPIGANVEATGDLLQKADAISKAADKINAIQDLQKNGSPTGLTLQQVQDYNDAMNKILELNKVGTGVLVGADGGIQTRFGRFALSLNEYGNAGAVPKVDPHFNIGQISGQAGSGVALPSDPTAVPADLASAQTQLTNVITSIQTNFDSGLTSNAGQAANYIINNAITTGGLSHSDVTQIVNNISSLNSLVNSQLGSTPSSGNLASNNTRVDLTAVSMTEVAMGYGHAVPLNEKYGTLSIGGNAKLLRGETGFASINVLNGDNTDVGSTISDALKQTKTSLKPALDLGIMYRLPFSHRLQLGMVGRNLNSPSFDAPVSSTAAADGFGTYKEKAQVRAGVAFWPLKRWAISGDLDLTKNNTMIPGYDSQTWGLGTEFKIWLLDLRAGLMKNFEEKAPTTYTAGIGLNIWAIKIDVAGAISSKSVAINDKGDKIPSSAQVGVNIGFVFGQGQERHDNVPTSATTPKTAVPASDIPQ